MLASLLLTAAASAGGGPWVVGAGRSSIYLGSESQRLTELAVSTGSTAAADLIAVGSGISTLGAKAIVSYGLLPRLELEGSLPAYRVRANRTDDPLCDALGLDACKATEGLGVAVLRAKALILDELYGPPLSIAIGPELRLGGLTAPDRERLTNLGEGTTDLGGFLSLGRTGILGSAGAWSAYTELGYRYRFPNTERFDGDLAVPGSELFGSLDALAGPSLTWAIGPTVTAYSRPSGLDFEDLLADTALLLDVDRFAALKVTAIQAGGKLIVRGSEQVTLSTAVLRTVFAVNNPSDVLTFSVGLTIQ